MQQNQTQSLSQRFQQYRPSKTALFWSCAGCVVVATVVGFSWGGWTTGGSAQDMADKAAASEQFLTFWEAARRHPDRLAGGRPLVAAVGR